MSEMEYINSFEVNGKNYAMRAAMYGKNILHNWDFRNPVNQRVADKYDNVANAIYMLDRWQSNITNAIGNFEIVNDAFRVTKVSGGNVGIRQILEFGHLYYGKEVTLSAEIDNRIFNSTLIVPFPSDTNVWLAKEIINGWLLDILVVPSGTVFFRLYSLSHLPNGSYIDIQAVKLELGPASTLANDPPMDFGRELAVCQRYFQSLNPMNVPLTGVRMTNFTANTVNFFIPLQQTIRIVPTITSTSDSPFFVVNPNNTNTNEFTFSVGGAIRANGLLITATRNNHGLTDAALNINPGTFLEANL